MPDRNGETVLLEALGGEPTDERRADVARLLGIMSRAGYLIDDPSSAPMLALFAIVWSRLPLASEVRTDYATDEKLDHAAKNLHSQIEALGGALADALNAWKTGESEFAQKQFEQIGQPVEKVAGDVAALATSVSALRDDLPKQLEQIGQPVAKVASDVSALRGELQKLDRPSVTHLHLGLPAGLKQRFARLRAGDWGIFLHPTTWLVLVFLLIGFVLGLFSAPGFAHLNAWLGAFQK